VYGLIEETSAWLQTKGVAQWNPIYPIERYRREIEAGYVWYWKGETEPVATVTILPHRPDYYPAGLWGDEIPAWHLCRFVVARKLSGRGVGEQLLNELESDAARAGISRLRLDVSGSNPFLERYYLAQGFLSRGTAEIMGARSVILERPVRARSP
jgi:GNAT superfamily N-acetyltransferase